MARVPNLRGLTLKIFAEAAAAAVGRGRPRGYAYLEGNKALEEAGFGEHSLSRRGYDRWLSDGRKKVSGPHRAAADLIDDAWVSLNSELHETVAQGARQGEIDPHHAKLATQVVAAREGRQITGALNSQRFAKARAATRKAEAEADWWEHRLAIAKGDGDIPVEWQDVEAEEMTVKELAQLPPDVQLEILRSMSDEDDQDGGTAVASEPDSRPPDRGD